MAAAARCAVPLLSFNYRKSTVTHSNVAAPHGGGGRGRYVCCCLAVLLMYPLSNNGRYTFQRVAVAAVAAVAVVAVAVS